MNSYRFCSPVRIFLARTALPGRLALPLLTLLASSAPAEVSPVGVDSTAGPNWRTGATLESDGEYGTAGYVVFGLNAADSIYMQPFDISSGESANAYALPDGVEVSTLDTGIGMWSGNGNFGTMEDPVAGGVSAAPVLANSAGTRQFTISRTSAAAWRLTFITASGDNEGTEYTLTVDDGSGPRTSTWDHVANGLVYHVFDVTEGATDIAVNVASVGQNRSLTGIAFDPVPSVLAPPAFLTHPASATVIQGGPATFTASATGSGVSYQWQRNGTDLPGAAGNSLTFLTAAADNGLPYRCVATNGAGSDTSDPAVLTLVPPAARSADYQAAVAAETSRIAHFSFDGDTGSALTNGESASFGGTLQTGRLTGAPGRTAGTAALAGTANLTADTEWEFPDESGTVEMLFYQSAASAYNPCLFSIRETSASVRISVHCAANGNQLFFWNGANVATWTTPLNTIGRLNHVAFVFDAGTVTAYFDGASLGSQDVPLGSTFGLPAQIGAADPAGGERLAGAIDEVALYSDPLTPAAIQAHATAWFGAAPVVNVPPASQSIVSGGPVTFFVNASGPDLTWQWQRNGSDVPGANGPTLSFLTTAADNGATYHCVVANGAGSITSDDATLTLTDPAPGTAAYRAAVAAEPSRLAYFPFDGDLGPDITNTVSAPNGGTLRGGSFLTGEAGRVAGTTALSGTAGLNADPAWEFSDDETGTVEALVYQSAAVGYNPCFFSIRDTGGVRYSLHGATDGNTLYFWNGSAVTSWPTPSNMIGRLTHVAVVFDAGAVTACFNGQPLETQFNSLGFSFGISAQIGSSTDGSAELWPGTVDELAIYSDALPASSLAAHAAAWFGSIAPPLITGVSRSSGLIFLTVPSVTGAVYSLESSVDLASPWEPVAGSAQDGTGEDLIFSTPAGGTAGFYRIRISR